MQHRGFTLVELSYVLGILGLLAAVAVPSYHVIMLRARAAEARTLLPAIAHAELMYRRDHGAFLACPAGNEPVPKREVPFAARTCWDALGVRAEGGVRYRYQVSLTASGFEAVAEGDLDGDGNTSRFTLSSTDLGIITQDEFE
jgi:prepilin-type N-terminal cleavage/methylation domain-containing protein